MKILVAYVCGECGHQRERWVPRPAETKIDCDCGGSARRRFGIALLNGTKPDRSSHEARTGLEQHSCASHAGVPGSCVLTPTAARSLAARARGDNRALDAEFAAQERAIAAGTLDPAAPITTASSAQVATQIQTRSTETT